LTEEKSRFLTIMVIPDTAGAEVRRLRVPRSWFKLGISLVAVAVVGFVALGGYDLYLLGQVSDLDEVRSDNIRLKSRIAQLDDEVQTMGRVVERVQQFDTRLRKITSFSDPDRNLAIGGPVGMETSEVRAAPLANAGTQRMKQDLLGAKGSMRELDLLEGRAELLGARALEAEASVRELHVFLEDQQTVLAATPSLTPTRGWRTSTFGFRVDPYTGLRQMHAGLDISANIGTRVISSASGVVTWAGSQNAYGNLVAVDHGHGLSSRYAHLAKLSVKVGDKVERGTTLGEVGNTGRSTGPHLHYEVRLNGIPQDPERFILDSF
jgi:murein DD-endopeptidase MepM/ murein hydrolase activator NlpD